MQTITIEDAQARLPELIEHLQPGEEVVILRDQKPVARIVAACESGAQAPRLGTLKWTVRYMAPDFDAPLEDFREYME
jgi:antitoxin (DNA-binding transcriptional repressor) of toxin-antitoxin stability system